MLWSYVHLKQLRRSRRCHSFKITWFTTSTVLIEWTNEMLVIIFWRSTQAQKHTRDFIREEKQNITRLMRWVNLTVANAYTLQMLRNGQLAGLTTSQVFSCAEFCGFTYVLYYDRTHCRIGSTLKLCLPGVRISDKFASLNSAKWRKAVWEMHISSTG